MSCFIAYYKYYTNYIKIRVFGVEFCVLTHFGACGYLCNMDITIKQWIDDPDRDYDTGVELFSSNGGNRSMVRYFSATKPRFAMKKLLYELGKMAKDEVVTLTISPDEPVSHTEPGATVPPVAAMAKQIVHDTWVELSRIHEELYNLGTENDETTVAKRKALLDEQQPLIERYNSVYEAKEAFFNGELSEEELQKVVDGKTETVEAPPVDYSRLSDLDLTKRIKAAKQAVNRYTNQLLYQQDTKGEAENPMPDSLKRQKIEQCMAVRNDELKQLLAIFEERGIGGAS